MRLAIDIGATKTAFACFDDDHSAMYSSAISTPNRSWDEFESLILSNVAKAESGTGAITDIGVSLAGIVSPTSGEVHCANLEVLSGRKLEQDLVDALNRPVVVSNDAACFTLAESRVGIAIGYTNVFGIILGSGIGGAAIINSQPVIGGSGYSGEWGHGNRLDHAVESLHLTKRQCGCGSKNCLDLFGAGIGMANVYFDYSGQVLDAKSILQIWHEKDSAAVRTVDAFVHLVSNELALIINVIDPQIVPVGGGLSNDADLIGLIDSETRRKSLGQLSKRLVVPGTCKTNGCLLGASFL